MDAQGSQRLIDFALAPVFASGEDWASLAPQIRDSSRYIERSRPMPRIVIFAGDGVGPEVVGEAAKVLTAVEGRLAIHSSWNRAPSAVMHSTGSAFPCGWRTLKRRGADAALLGAVGGPKWDAVRAVTSP